MNKLDSFDNSKVKCTGCSTYLDKKTLVFNVCDICLQKELVLCFAPLVENLEKDFSGLPYLSEGKKCE
jgi:hypothetical protein